MYTIYRLKADELDLRFLDALKASFKRVTGVILKPLDNNTITIQTQDGPEQSYEVRPLIQKNFANLSKGETVILFVDDENKVTDASMTGSEHQP